MKRTLAFLLILVSTGAFIRALAHQSVPSRALAIIHVNVIDATGAPMKPDMTVIIRSGRIASVGKSRRVRVPRGAEIIDASGKFLIPGLWDMHAHLGTDDFDKRGHLALFVVNGVTGIRIMDGDPAFHQWRDEITAGALVGPRMVIASPILGQSPISSAAARAVAGKRDPRGFRESS